MDFAGANSVNAAISSSCVGTTKTCLPAPAVDGRLKAAARQQLEPAELLADCRNKARTALLATDQETLRQLRHVELLQRQQELGRRLLILQEEQRRRDEAGTAGSTEWSSWRWITSTASDAASEEEAAFGEYHINTSATSGAPHTCSGCCPSESSTGGWMPPEFSVGDYQYEPQVSGFSNATNVHMLSHSTTAAGENSESTRLHHKTRQSEQHLYCVSNAPPARIANPAAASVRFPVTTVTGTESPAGAAPVHDGSSGLSFPHLLWQEEEDVENGGGMRAQEEFLNGARRTNSAGTQPSPELAAAVAVPVPDSHVSTVDIEQGALFRYPFPEAAVLWESSSSCCSDTKAGLTSVGDEWDHREQQLATHPARGEQQYWTQHQREQMRNVLKPAGSAAVRALLECRADATVSQVKESCNSFPTLQEEMHDVTVASESGSCHKRETSPSIKRSRTVPPAKLVDAVPVSVSSARSYSCVTTGEKKDNAENKYAREKAAAPVPVSNKSISTAAADPGAADISTAALPFTQTPCTAKKGGTVNGERATFDSESSFVIHKAAEHLSNPKLSELMQGHRMLPPRAAGEVAVLQRPAPATSSPRTIVPLHRHWVQQLLLQQKKHQQRAQRLQQQQQRLRHQSQKQSVPKQPQQHIRQQQQQQQVRHTGQQQDAREQKQRQPQRRYQVLSQTKLAKQRGQRDQPATSTHPTKTKDIPTVLDEERKSFCDCGKTSTTESRLLVADAPSHAHNKRERDIHVAATCASATLSSPLTDAFATAVPFVATAAACYHSGAAPDLAPALASTDRAATAAPPAAVATTSGLLGAATAFDKVSFPAGASAATADVMCAPPSPGMSQLGCRDDASFAFAALADVLCQNAAGDLFSKLPPTAEAPCYPILSSSSIDPCSATAPRSVSRAPPLPHTPTRCQALPLSTTAVEGHCQLRVGTSAGAPTGLHSKKQQQHALHKDLRHPNTLRTVSPAVGASGPKKSSVLPAAAATGGKSLSASTAYIQSNDNTLPALKAIKEKKQKARSSVDPVSLDVSQLSFSYFPVNPKEGDLHRSAPDRKRISVSAARAVVAAQQRIDMPREHTANAAPDRGAARASGASVAVITSAAALSVSPGDTLHLVAPQAGALAVSGPVREQIETYRQTGVHEKSRVRTSNQRGVISGEKDNFERKLPLFSRTSGKGGHIKSESEKDGRASKSAQSLDKQQQQQGDVPADKRVDGGLVVEGLHVSKQKDLSFTEDMQRMQLQHCGIDQGLARGRAKEDEGTAGGQAKQQHTSGEYNTGIRDTLKSQSTFQTLRKKLLRNETEASHALKLKQHGAHAMCRVDVASELEKNCSHEQLQHHPGPCSNCRRSSHCGAVSAKKLGIDADSRLSRSSNHLPHSAVYWCSTNKIMARNCKKDRHMREATAAALKASRCILKDEVSVSKDLPVGREKSVGAACNSSTRNLSPATGLRDRSLHRLSTSVESTTGQQTNGWHTEEQRGLLRKLRLDRRKEALKRPEISYSAIRHTHALTAGAGGIAGVPSGTSGVLDAGEERNWQRSVGNSRQSSRSRCSSSSSSTSCTPSTILRRLRQLLQEESKPLSLSPEYHMGRLNRRRKSERQKKGSTDSSTCGSMSVKGRTRNARPRRKTDHSSKNNTRGDRSDSGTTLLDSTSVSSFSSHARGSSSESSDCRKIAKASRKMWELLVAKSRRRLLAGSNTAGSIQYSTSVSSSGRCRKRGIQNNTDSRREMSSCSEASSRSSEASRRSSEASSIDSEVSSIDSEGSINSSEVSGTIINTVTSSSDLCNRFFRQIAFEESKTNPLGFSVFKRHFLQKKRKINFSAARCYLADMMAASACRGGHPAGVAAGRHNRDAAGSSSSVALAAEAPISSRSREKAKEPAPSLISLWLQYSAANLEDTEQQHRRLLTSSDSHRQEVEKLLRNSGMLVEQNVSKESSNPPCREEKNSFRKRRYSRESCSSSEGSSRSRSSLSALDHISSCEEGSKSESSISSDIITHSSRCSLSDNDSCPSLDPDAIIRRIKRRLRLPLVSLAAKRTQRQQPQDFPEPSHISRTFISAGTSEKRTIDTKERVHPPLRQEQQREEPEQQQDQWRAQDKPEARENILVGDHEMKGVSVERDQQTLGHASAPHGQEPMPEGNPVDLLQQQQKQRRSEASRGDNKRGASATVTDDDPTGPLRLSALECPTVAASEKLEALTCRLREEEKRVDQQQEQQEDCDTIKQRLQPPEQPEADSQGPPGHEVKQDEQCCSLFCPTAATADQDAVFDTKETAANGTLHELDFSVLASAENLKPDSSPHTKQENPLPHAVLTTAQKTEATSSEKDKRTAGDAPPFHRKGSKPDHQDGTENCISASDAMRAEEIPGDHVLLHSEGGRQTVNASVQEKDGALEGQTQIQGQRQKADELQKCEKILYQQQKGQQNPQHQTQTVCQVQIQQAEPCAVVEKKRGEANRNLDSSQCEAVPKLQPLSNCGSQRDLLLEERQFFLVKKTQGLACFPSNTAGDSFDVDELVGADAVLNVTEKNGLSSTALDVLSAEIGVSADSGAVAAAGLHSPTAAPNAAAKVADTASVDSCAPVTALAKLEYPAIILPAAAAASTDNDVNAKGGDACPNGSALYPSVESAATLVSVTCEQAQATTPSAGGDCARLDAAIAGPAGDVTTVNCASSIGSFSFSLSSSSGNSGVADSPRSNKLKQNSESSRMGQSRSDCTVGSDVANGSCCINKHVDTDILNTEKDTHLIEETHGSPGRELHTLSESSRGGLTSQVTAAPGLTSLASREPTEGTTAAKKAGAAGVAADAETEEATTSAEVPNLAAAGICESARALVEAEAGNGSSNEIAAKDTRTAAIATSRRPSSAVGEETESGQREFEKDCLVSARENETGVAYMQQVPQPSQSTYGQPRLNGRDACSERLFPPTNSGAESRFSNACAADVAWDASGGQAGALLVPIGANCPAIHGYGRADILFPDGEADVGMHASVRSHLGGTPTSPLKDQQLQQHEGFVPCEVVLTKEVPPPEVLDIVMQQQRLLQISTKHFCLPVKRAVCDSIFSSVSEEEGRCSLPSLSETGSYKPADAPVISLEDVPELHAECRTSYGEQPKQRGTKKKKKNDFQRKQQQAARARRKCCTHSPCPRDVTTADRGILKTIEEKLQREFQTFVQILNVTMDKHNRAENVLASGDTGEPSPVEHLGSGNGAKVLSGSAFFAGEETTAIGISYLSALLSSRVRARSSEPADTVFAACGVLVDAFSASAAAILRAASSEASGSFSASLRFLGELLRRKGEFLSCGRIHVPGEPCAPSSDNLPNAVEHYSKCQRKAKEYAATNIKESNSKPLPTSGETHTRSIATNSTKEETHQLKRRPLGRADFATAAVANKQKEKGGSSRCQRLRGGRRGDATPAECEGESSRAQQTAVMCKENSESSSSTSQTQTHFFKAIGDSSKRQDRIEHAGEDPRRTSCKRGHRDRKSRHRQISQTGSKTFNSYLQQSASKSDTNQKSTSHIKERNDKGGFRRNGHVSETDQLLGCRGATRLDNRSRKVKKCRRRRRCYQSGDASGRDSGDRERAAYDDAEAFRSSVSSPGGVSCCSFSECEERGAEERAAAAKHPRYLHHGITNTENNKGRRGPQPPPPHCPRRQQQQYRQQRQHNNTLADTDTAGIRAERSETQSRNLASGHQEQRCTYPLVAKQRDLERSNMRKDRDTLLEHSILRQLLNFVSESPLIKEKKIQASLSPLEQVLSQGTKQETAQLLQGQIERNLTEQPDFAWCWRKWGGYEIYEQQRNRLQAVLRDALEGFA